VPKKPHTPLPPLDLLRRYPIDDAAAYLGISRATLYNDIAAGLIHTIKHGTRRFVPASEIARLSSAA
jgi:excisionase family DNA binding protein